MKHFLAGFLTGLLLIGTALNLTGCVSQAQVVSQNLSEEADNFNVVRKVIVIDCITGDTLFEVVGKISIRADREDNQLEIISEENGQYAKHFVGLSDNATYVVEQLNVKDVNNYKFAINYNPKMWIPVEGKVID